MVFMCNKKTSPLRVITIPWAIPVTGAYLTRNTFITLIVFLDILEE